VQPLYPGFENAYHHCFVNLIENVSDPLQYVWPAPAIVAKRFSLRDTKGRSNVRAVGWMRQPFGFGGPSTSRDSLDLWGRVLSIWISHSLNVL
jgi:hypothetical protein